MLLQIIRCLLCFVFLRLFSNIFDPRLPLRTDTFYHSITLLLTLDSDLLAFGFILWINMRCINCGIAMQRLQRHLISSLSAHHQTRLSRWITNAQTQLRLDTFICHPCFLLLSTEAGEHERLLGHNMVCLGCGKSVRKIRHHNVSMDCPLLAVLLSQNTNYVPSRNNYVCHVCWMRTNRQAEHDSSRDMQESASDNNVAAPNVQVVSPPEPPPLPPVQSGPLRRESNTLLIWLCLKQLFM